MDSAPVVVPDLTPEHHTYTKYTEELADYISDLFIEGESIASICRRPGMPRYKTYFKWVKERSDFREKMQASRIARAMHFESLAIEAGMAYPDKDAVAAHRLAFETAKWAASVNDPSVYGNQTKVTGDVNAPLQFVISTGFPPLSPEQEAVKLGPDGLIIRGGNEDVKLPPSPELLPSSFTEVDADG